jgi:hypothetical protein
VPEGVLLDPAADLIHAVQAQLDHVKWVEYPDRVGQLDDQRGDTQRNGSSDAVATAAAWRPASRLPLPGLPCPTVGVGAWLHPGPDGRQERR